MVARPLAVGRFRIGSDQIIANAKTSSGAPRGAVSGEIFLRSVDLVVGESVPSDNERIALKGDDYEKRYAREATILA